MLKFYMAVKLFDAELFDAVAMTGIAAVSVSRRVWTGMTNPHFGF